MKFLRLLLCLLLTIGSLSAQDDDLNAAAPSYGGIDSFTALFSLSPQSNIPGWDLSADSYRRGVLLSESMPAPPDTSSSTKQVSRAVLEYFALMGYSQTKYWLTYGRWIEDWHYELKWKDQSRRFLTFEAWKFDSNNFILNWTHGMAGALYFNFARSNHLNKWESLLFGMASSLYWEYIAEWRNVISINDNIMTTLGGFALGEAWYQLGIYLDSQFGDFNLLTFLNPILKLNRWIDRKNQIDPPSYTLPGWHEIRFFMGARDLKGGSDGWSRAQIKGGFHAQLILSPEYGKTGKINRRSGKTLFSEVYADISGNDFKYKEFNLAAKVVYLGYFEQDIDLLQRGYSYFVGLGSAFSVFKKRPTAFYDGGTVKVKRDFDLRLDESRDFRDKLAAVHILGPVFDYTAFSSPWKIRLGMDAFLDFGLVNAFALNEYSENNDILGIKTTLFYYGYYQALGASLSSRLTVNCRNLEFKSVVLYQFYDSIEGADRFQDELSNDFSLSDSRLRYFLSLGYFVPVLSIELLVSYEGIDRRGTIREIRTKELESRLFMGLSYKF